MFDYSDNIHFVGYQLDHYYGTNNWPWRMCAEVTGVSISTVRKYYNQQWEVEQEKFDLINRYKIEKSPLKSRTLKDGKKAPLCKGGWIFAKQKDWGIVKS